MDFNVNPMTATLAFVKDDKMWVFDEIYLKDSNTSAMASTLRQKVMAYKSRIEYTTINPDSTGAKATTNSSRSDHQILKDAGFKVMSAANPFRIDRYAAVNVNFEKERIIIDPKCKHLIKDLEQVSYKEGTDKPDTADPMLTHISDALGYTVFRNLNPFRAKIKPVILE